MLASYTFFNHFSFEFYNVVVNILVLYSFINCYWRLFRSILSYYRNCVYLEGAIGTFNINVIWHVYVYPALHAPITFVISRVPLVTVNMYYIHYPRRGKNIITICRTQCKHKHRLDFSKNVLVYSILLTVTCSHTHAAGLARTPLPPLGHSVVSHPCHRRFVDFLNPCVPINHTVRKHRGSPCCSFSLITH